MTNSLSFDGFCQALEQKEPWGRRDGDRGVRPFLGQGRHGGGAGEGGGVGRTGISVEGPGEACASSRAPADSTRGRAFVEPWWRL